MAEPQIAVDVVPLSPGRPELGVFVGWHCWWKGQEYGHVTTRLIGGSLIGPPDAAELVAAMTEAKADAEATMKKVTDAQP